jgi:hypothetical protein
LAENLEEMELKSYHGMIAVLILFAKPLLRADLVEVVYVLAKITAILTTGLLFIMLANLFNTLPWV